MAVNRVQTSVRVAMPLGLWVLLHFVAFSVARECGQPEIDAQNITGCTSVLHMKYLGHQGAIWLGDALHHNPDLETLDLHHTRIGDDDALALAAGLHNNTHLKRLQMHNNNILDRGAAALGKALLENDRLEFLSLSSNGVGDEGAKGLAEGLRGNARLKRLDLYFNVVGNAGAIALANALRLNTGLRTLHLDTNRIEDEGGLALASAIRGERASLFSRKPAAPPAMIGELGLAYNQLSNIAVDALLNAAKANPAIHRLAVDHNHQMDGATKDAWKTDHVPAMEARKQIAQWIIDAGLHVGFHAGDSPPLASAVAPAVLELKAHTSEGILALRHYTANDLAKLPAIASLDAADRDPLIAALLKKVAALVAHDEL